MKLQKNQRDDPQQILFMLSEPKDKVGSNIFLWQILAKCLRLTQLLEQIMDEEGVLEVWIPEIMGKIVLNLFYSIFSVFHQSFSSKIIDAFLDAPDLPGIDAANAAGRSESSSGGAQSP